MKDPVADKVVRRDIHRRRVQEIKERARVDLNAEQYALYMDFLTGRLARTVAKQFDIPLTIAEEAVAKVSFKLRFPNPRQPSRFHLFDSDEEIAEARARVKRDYLGLGCSEQDAEAEAQAAPFQRRAPQADDPESFDVFHEIGRLIAARFRTCPSCGRFIVSDRWGEMPKGRKRQYCSDRCRQASYRRRLSARTTED